MQERSIGRIINLNQSPISSKLQFADRFIHYHHDDRDPGGGRRLGDSQRQMRKRLISEGVTFVARTRTRTIPLVTSETLSEVTEKLGLAGDPLEQAFKDSIDNMVNYLRGQAITDRFGSEDVQRGKWRYSYQNSPDRDIFNAIYDEPNQLRVNKLQEVQSGIIVVQQILEHKHHPEFSAAVQEIGDRLQEQVVDSNTYNALSDEQKKTIVRSYEDGIIEILRMLPGITEKEKIRIT